MDESRQDQAVLELMRSLEAHAADLDPNRFVPLMAAARTRPQLFSARRIGGQTCVRWLGKSSPSRSAALCVLACGLLLRAHESDSNWSVDFIQCYLEDSFGPRVWCDDPSAAVRQFVAQLLTFFSDAGGGAQTRFADTSARTPIVQYVIDQSRFVLEHDVAALPAVLRTLTPLAGVRAVRELVALHLRSWLRDSNLASLAKSLALAMLADSNLPPPILFQVIGEHLIGEPMLDSALRRCVGASAQAAAMALEAAFSTDGATQRLLLLRATEALLTRGAAAVEPLLARQLCQSALSLCEASGDDSQPASDESLMRLARGRRQLYALLAVLMSEVAAIDVAALCYALLDGDGGARDMPSARARLTYAETVARCATWALLLRAHALPPQQHAVFKQTVALVQSQAVAWCHKTAGAVLVGERDGVLASLVRRVLFVLADGGAAAYFPDSSLGAAAQSAALALVTDGVPLLEATLVHLIVMRLSHMPLSADDVVSAVEALAARAVAAAPEAPPPPLASYEQLVDGLVNVCRVASSDTPCHVSLLWRVVLALSMLGALHPATVGGFLWRAAPTVGAVMRSMLTQRWQHVREYAGELVPFERESTLLAPSDALRRHVQHIDATLRLSERLARCRAPDFVLDAAAAEPEAAAPWLARLLRAKEALIESVAPVCRCVVLLASADDDDLRRSVSTSLRTLLQNELSTVEVLTFFLGQLSAPLGGVRDAAVECGVELFGGVEQLPRLPWYDSPAVRRVIGDSLSAALAVEMSLERCQQYQEALRRVGLAETQIENIFSQRPLFRQQTSKRETIDLDGWLSRDQGQPTLSGGRFLFEII